MTNPFYPKRTPEEITEIEDDMTPQLYMALYKEGMLDSQQPRDEDEAPLGEHRSR